MRKWWGLKILYFLEKVNDLWLHAFSVPELGTCPHTWHTSLGADGDAARLLATMAREYRQELGFKNPMKSQEKLKRSSKSEIRRENIDRGVRVLLAEIATPIGPFLTHLR